MILTKNNSKYSFSNEGENVKLEGSVILDLHTLSVSCSAVDKNEELLAEITYMRFETGKISKSIINTNRENLSEIDSLLESTIDSLLQRFNFS